jgi:hypothetical protein
LFIRYLGVFPYKKKGRISYLGLGFCGLLFLTFCYLEFLFLSATPVILAMWRDELLVFLVTLFRIPLSAFAPVLGVLALLFQRREVADLMRQLHRFERVLFRVWNRRVTYRYLLASFLFQALFVLTSLFAQSSPLCV